MSNHTAHTLVEDPVGDELMDVGKRPPILQQQGSAKDALDEICEISRKTERIIYLKFN
jgi:hypothetical protein